MGVAHEPFAELAHRAVVLQFEELKLVLEDWRPHLINGTLGNDSAW